MLEGGELQSGRLARSLHQPIFVLHGKREAGECWDCGDALLVSGCEF